MHTAKTNTNLKCMKP